MVDLQDFKDWFETARDATPKHKASLDPITDYPMADNCLTLILGATGSGKSYVLKDIFDKVPYDVIFFISPTATFDQTANARPMDCKYLVNCDDPEHGVAKVYEYLMRRLLINELRKDYQQLVDEKRLKVLTLISLTLNIELVSC